MKRALAALIVCFAAAFDPRLCAQSVNYAVPAKPWDTNLGTHRAVVVVAEKAAAVQAHLEWRRRDADPAEHGVVVVDARTGERVRNSFAGAITNDSGDVVFEPVSGAGEYFIYFLPGDPGRGSFPSAKYLPPQDTASAEWKAIAGAANDGWKKLAAAKVTRWEARTEHDRFNEMEIIATEAERAAWLAKHPGVSFFVFPEMRERPVRMFDRAPEIWLKRDQPPELAARPNEYFVFQLGVWAATANLANVSLRFSEFKADSGASIPAAALHSFNLSGIDWLGNPTATRVDVRKDAVQPLWCALDLQDDVKPGRYIGWAEIASSEIAPRRVPLAFTISGPPLADRGDGEPGKHTKLRWLDSTIAQDDEPTKPFTPLRVEGRTIHCLGRSVTLGDDGLPARITSFFNGGVTKIVARGREVLAEPMRFAIELADGKTLPLRASDFRFEKSNSGAVEWTSRSTGDTVAMRVSGRMEFDGQVELRCALEATRPVEVKDIRLEIPRTRDTAKLAIGLGLYGGAAPQTIDWKWDVAKRDQDALWLGDVNAGLRVQLRAENYTRPMVNIHYGRHPLNDPPSWSGDGKGGVKVSSENAGVTLISALSGARSLRPDQPLHFDFDLSITPFKPLNTEAQGSERYYHSSGVTDPQKIRESGANVVNVHQGNALNPYINYPFLTADKLREYTNPAHSLGERVKFYYTVRELTNWTPELFAMRSLGSELIAPGAGGGHAWCEEHLGGDYWGAWYEGGVNDASVLTATMSRWHNVYLEGLRWLVENTGCDGLYLDDISYDRTVMKRARKILDRTDARGGLIDLHSWNEMNARAGFASCALIFMDSMPFIDRLWFGEGHHYDGPPEQTLVAISGVPFGLMGEMLQGGGNPWLGLTFGMTGRLGWGGSPQAVWKLWDDFGVVGSEFIGWWDAESPVKTNAPEVKATIWKKSGRTLIVVGNFGDQPARTRLAIDWNALGLRADNANLYAPEMANFQQEMLLKPDAEIALAPKRSFAFVLDETPRTAPKQAAAFALDKSKLIFDETFVPQPREGWKFVASKKADSVKPDKEGLVFLAPANTHGWAERALPENVAIVAAQIRQDSGDDAQQWGPGLALVWPDGKILKANRRRDGRFGLSINGQEKLAGACDIDAPVTIAIVLEKQSVRVIATGEGTYQHDEELAIIPRAEFPSMPAVVRIGKMPNSGQPRDFSSPGTIGWSRCDWLKFYHP